MPLELNPEQWQSLAMLGLAVVPLMGSLVTEPAGLVTTTL